MPKISIMRCHYCIHLSACSMEMGLHFSQFADSCWISRYTVKFWGSRKILFVSAHCVIEDYWYSVTSNNYEIFTFIDVNWWVRVYVCFSINGLHPKPRKVLQLFRLRQINNGVFVKLNKATINMLRLAEPYITWGSVHLLSSIMALCVWYTWIWSR